MPLRWPLWAFGLIHEDTVTTKTSFQEGGQPEPVTILSRDAGLGPVMVQSVDDVNGRVASAGRGEGGSRCR